MKKISLLLVLIMLLMASSPAFADGTETQLIQLYSDLPAVAYTSTSAISGRVVAGASVEVKLNNAEIYKRPGGAVGYFYTTVKDLKMGGNTVVITAKKGSQTQTITGLITRRSGDTTNSVETLDIPIKNAISISFK